ncbi:histone-lysine N-methyltransferase SETD7 isoform X1 [Lates japonicus]|uniref:Histone-lysine N-methyltransferase SETD7 n=1 Tax=Lates japonicus TaxID=270547 RepID=A0AAD3NCL8_LATJO|nr:histone-lysine N-methyltransferase SETD7 isoform X1 [Lates japonicus]
MIEPLDKNFHSHVHPQTFVGVDQLLCSTDAPPVTGGVGRTVVWSSSSMDSDEENLEEVVEGPLDDDGQPHGFCTVTYSSSDRFEGHFTHGEKNGKGKFFFFDGRTLEGFYVDDALQGQGVYTYEDGGVLHGTYVDGELNGLAQEFDGEGRLVFKGQYKDNDRCGECWSTTLMGAVCLER